MREDILLGNVAKHLKDKCDYQLFALTKRLESLLEVTELDEGLNIVCGGDLNDPRDERQKLARRLLTLQTLDSSVKFLAVASKAFARPAAAPERPGMIVRGKERGTVSSTLIALGKKPRDAIFQYANGSPDVAKYEDYSPLLRDILSRGLREARTKQKA